ncbi:cell envelope integrity protein TolA [Legionella dresdenensis]|uniref:Cell envelope integrity protein TolA n=1 Tax=Legionella dresdenensis TaxID=450200 RepID=A0ABV8CG17_9GAMM
MIIDPSYRKALFAAICLHVFVGLMLLTDPSSQRPVLQKDNVTHLGEATPAQAEQQPKPEIVKAVSVDNKEVMETVNRLKQEREMQKKAEQARQQALVKQAEDARKARLQEQQKLAKIKEEAEKLAIARKKQMEEEQKRLKQLALQKEQEAKRLEELKNKQQQLEKKQQQEAQKLAELKKKQIEQLAQAEKQRLEKEQQIKASAEKIKAEQAAAEQARQQQADAERAQAEAAKRTRMAGEVDKYKALILNAIGRRWILPDNVDGNLSSQFRIRLAPDGAVLEVSLTRSSGDSVLDRSAQTAIYKASPLPVPADPETFNLFRDISLTVRPENVRG